MLKLSDAHNGLRVFNKKVADELRITLNGMGHASQIVDEVVSWIEERFVERKDYRTTHPAQSEPTHIMRYFVFSHLPAKLQDVSESFSDIAWEMEAALPPGPEKSTALRKLLEAKDAAVRAALDT